MAQVPVGTPEEWSAIICQFIRDHVRRAGATGVVLGLSGGLDSAVVAALACKALGKTNVTAVMLPSKNQNSEDESDALILAESLGIVPMRIPIEPIVSGLDAVIGQTQTLDGRVRGNAKSRARMIVLYALAQSRNLLVAGTGNKSEILIGYFTKHGDGGNDLQPIGDLYKTQVRQLAKHLKIPAKLIEKPPSAGLRPGQTDEADLGMSYELLDKILHGFELNQDIEAIANHLEISTDEVSRINKLVRQTEHKRHLSIIPKIGSRTVGIDWRRSVHWDHS